MHKRCDPIRTTVCGLNGSGFLEQTCTEGQWADSDTCDDPDICTNESVQSGTTVCGLNGTGFLDQICTEGQWIDTETCDDPDICVNGEVVDMSCGIGDVGSNTQSCVDGQWVDMSECLGEPVYGYLKAYGSQTWLIEATDLSKSRFRLRDMKYLLWDTVMVVFRKNSY